MAYTNIFGGSPVQPSNVAFRTITMAANVSLEWPTSFIDTTNVVARIMNVNATNINLNLIMPAASNTVSPGEDFLVLNTGVNNFSVTDNTGLVLQVCTPGIAYYFWLNTTATIGGIWNVITFGAGNNIVNLIGLVGNGLNIVNNLLVSNFPSRNVPATSAATANDRAFLLVWTGGVGTITLPPIAAAGVGVGFYLAVNNEGGGIVTVATPDGSTIDGVATWPMIRGTSSYFIADQNGWNTLGFGQRSLSAVTALLPPFDIQIAQVAGIVTLTAAQASFNILQFIAAGGLNQNTTIVFPAQPGIWEVFNNMISPGGFTVTAQPLGGIGVVVPIGGSYIIYSDGVQMYIVGANNGLPIPVAGGGTGVAAFTPYAVITGGTVAAGPLQNVAGVGTVGQVLISAGAGALPNWGNVGANDPALTPFQLLAGPPVLNGPITPIGNSGNVGEILISGGAAAYPSWITYGTRPGRNRILNGDFQIWQRSGPANINILTQGAGVWIYAADRWQCSGGLNQIAILETAGAIGHNWVLKAQRIALSADVTPVQVGTSLTQSMSNASAGNIITISFLATCGATYSSAGDVLNVQVVTGTGLVDVSFLSTGFVGQATVINQNVVLNPLNPNSLTNFTFSSAAISGFTTMLGVVFSYTPTGVAGINDYFAITDVQLEVSPVQTPFDRRSYQDELVSCKYFYNKSFEYGVLPVQNAGLNTGEICCLIGHAGALNNHSTTFDYPYDMRVVPNITLFNPAAANALAWDKTANVAMGATAIQMSTTKRFTFDSVGNAASAIGDLMCIHYTADADVT